MQKARACIISKNKALTRFFELELINLSYDVSIRTEIELTEEFDAVILDKDTVKGGVRCACPVLVVSEDTVAEGSRSLPWPTPIDSIREQLLRMLGEQASRQSVSEKEEFDGRIYATGERRFLIGGINVELSKNEAAILERLCRAKGEAVSRGEIMELLGAVEGNISDVYICLLRKKLERQLGRRLIFTHRNKGYSTCLTLE